MKKLVNNKNILIVVISLIIIALILIIVTKVFNKKEETKELESGVYISKETYQEPDAVIIKGRKLKKEKCLKDICISNVIINTSDNYNYVTYTVRNKGKGVQSGYLKVDFGKVEARLVYNELKAGETITTYTSSSRSLKGTKDFELKEISDEELLDINN